MWERDGVSASDPTGGSGPGLQAQASWLGQAASWSGGVGSWTGSRAGTWESKHTHTHTRVWGGRDDRYLLSAYCE